MRVKMREALDIFGVCLFAVTGGCVVLTGFLLVWEALGIRNCS